MRSRLLAASAFLPPAAFFCLWALAARQGMRGPAGGVAAAALLIPALGALVMFGLVLAGRIPAKSFPVHGAILMDIVLVVFMAIFLPTLRERYRMREEEHTRMALDQLRGLVAAEIKENQKVPQRLSDLIPARLPVLPLLNLPRTGHGATREVRLGLSTDIQDKGTWLYVNDSGDRNHGKVFIDCKHTDSRGLPWNAY